MLKFIRERVKQGFRTAPFPLELPVLSDPFRGLPEVDASRCPDGCRECAEACPTGAVLIDTPGPRIDLGRCLF